MSNNVTTEAQREGEGATIDIVDTPSPPEQSLPPQQPSPQEPSPQQPVNIPENVRILKEAFPETDEEVIEAVLQTQNDNLESTFEILLGMSDPNYKAAPAPQSPVTEQAPPMPPRPQSRQNSSSNSAPYAYWARQEQPEPTSVEEQLRMDEELAKKLALEDEMRSQQRRQSYQQQRQRPPPQTQNEDDDDSLFNLQEELPIIKEKMKEAGNAAKKKMMDLYNQFKANTQKGNMQNNNEDMPTSSIPATNAHYRGLPSDDGDDLLTGDISALHLSDYDVYAKTGGGRPRGSNEYQNTTAATGDDVIYVNPPLSSAKSNEPLMRVQTSTSDAQLKADEDFARQLAEEEQEQLEARRSREPSATMDHNTLRAPQMPPRKPISPTVVIAPRSPLEFEGDSDYEDVGLTAAPTNKLNNEVSINKPNVHENNLEESNSVPYVIGDDDDSDSDEDDLVDIDEEEESKSEKKHDAIENKLNTATTKTNTNDTTNITTTTTTTTTKTNRAEESDSDTVELLPKENDHEKQPATH